MNDTQPLDARAPRDEVVDVLAATLMEMLARGQIGPPPATPPDRQPSEAEPCR